MVAFVVEPSVWGVEVGTSFSTGCGVRVGSTGWLLPPPWSVSVGASSLLPLWGVSVGARLPPPSAAGAWLGSAVFAPLSLLPEVPAGSCVVEPPPSLPGT